MAVPEPLVFSCDVEAAAAEFAAIAKRDRRGEKVVQEIKDRMKEVLYHLRGLYLAIESADCELLIGNDGEDNREKRPILDAHFDLIEVHEYIENLKKGMSNGPG